MELCVKDRLFHDLSSMNSFIYDPSSFAMNHRIRNNVYNAMFKGAYI